MNANAPTISVIIPTYNSADVVGDALRSCLEQTCPPLEILVINDGSTDALDAALQPFRDRIVLHSQANQGAAAARNRGARLAKGEWLLFLDADDLLFPNALADLQKAAAQTSAGVIFGRVIEHADGRDRTCVEVAGPPPVPALRNFHRALIVTPGAALVRRSLHLEVEGFDGLFWPSDDRNYWMRLGSLAAFEFCDTRMLHKRTLASSASLNLDRTVLQGMLAQLGYLFWAGRRGLDTDFLHTSRSAIVAEALEKAFRQRCWKGFRAVALYAELNRICGPDISAWLARYRPWTPLSCRLRDRVAAWLPFLRRGSV